MGGSESIKSAAERRTEFERDYGRTVYSTPFRRLLDKAQVFPLETHDSVRTRLVHSLEVSSVAEDLATQAVREVIQKRTPLENHHASSIPLIAATCGLIHDIGNPPFGHAGELAMSSWFEDMLREEPKFFDLFGGEKNQKALDFLKFEGNAQGIRTVSNLYTLTHPFGLNFTCGTLSAACKYIASSCDAGAKPGHEYSKPGFFWSEQSILERVREQTGTAGCRNPIAYLVEAADDIVYCCVDLEDGVRRGTLKWDVIEENLRRFSSEDSFVDKVLTEAKYHANSDWSQGKSDDLLAQTFRIAAISNMVPAVLDAFGTRYDQIMNGDYHEEIVDDPCCLARPMIAASKKILKTSLYTCPEVLQLEIRGRTVIHQLMDFFWEAISSYHTEGVTTKTYGGKIYHLISTNYSRLFEKRIGDSQSAEDGLYSRLQLLTDQVAGMTDTYACRLHKELTNY